MCSQYGHLPRNTKIKWLTRPLVAKEKLGVGNRMELIEELASLRQTGEASRIEMLAMGADAKRTPTPKPKPSAKPPNPQTYRSCVKPSSGCSLTITFRSPSEMQTASTSKSTKSAEANPGTPTPSSRSSQNASAAAMPLSW